MLGTRIRMVIEAMYADQGLNIPTVRNMHVPEKFNDERHLPDERIDWSRVERFLNTLSFEELTNFAIGDMDIIEEIAERGGDEGNYANAALNSLFEQIGE